MRPSMLFRKEIVTAYCYLWEAERSIHRAINPACRWGDFVAYYHPSKLAALTQFARRFQPALITSNRAFPTQHDARHVLGPGLLTILVSVCIGRWKSRWRFSDSEIAFLGATFEALVQLLQSELKPTADMLIDARMAVYDAVRIIERRCQGLAELQRAKRVVYFDQSPNLPLLPISEILRDVA